MQAGLHGRIAKLRTTIALIVVLVALVLPTTAGAELAGSGSEVRIGAQRLDDGRTEFALQVREESSWSELVLPRSRFFPTTAGVDDWLNSSALNLDSGHTVRISAKLLDDDRIEFALQQHIGGEWVDRLLPRPRLFPANAAVGRWLYSGRLEPVGYVPIQSRAASVGGIFTVADWFETSDGDGYSSGPEVRTEADGQGAEASGGQVIFMVRCDVLPNGAGALGISATAFQRLSGPRRTISLTYQLDDDEPVAEEWNLGGDPLSADGVSLIARDPDTLFERLRTASSIRLQVAGFPDVDVTFDITDLYKTGIQENLEQCGNYLPQPWPDRWPQAATEQHSFVTAVAILALLDNPDVAEIAVAVSPAEEVVADAPRGFVGISVSATHGCAITSDDQLVCWGSNENGQLNLPDEEYTSVVTARGYTCAIAGDGQLRCSGLLTLANEGEHPWVSVNASVEFACAVDSEGNGACWPKDSGLYDDTGQLEVPTDRKFREIAAALNLACGITTADDIVCWGSWTSKAIPGVIPLEVPSGTFTDIAMGDVFACAVRTSGALACWGANPYGQTDAPSGSYTAVSAGWAHSCALTTDGEMVCWGHDGNYDELLTYPHGAYRALDVALSTTCGITTAGEAVCWGYNGDGQADAPDGRYIGDAGRASDEALPAVDIAGAHSSSCALIDDGSVVCWGAYEQAEDGVGSPRPKHSGRPWEAKPADRRFKSISTGWSHSCGLTSEGVVHCWGFNDYGQLDVPTGRYQSVAASLYYSCGLRTDGQIRCWGQNDFSGYGSTTPPTTGGPTGQAAPPSGKFTAVSAGWEHACALNSNREIVCWGRNHNGQADPPDGQYEAISAGWDYSCALTDGGSIDCWGLGPEHAPAAKYASVSTGWEYACGVTTGYQLRCWGSDGHGRASPPAGDFIAVKAGKVHTCGVRTDGTVTCWGFGFYGQTKVPRNLRAGQRDGVIQVTQLDGGGLHATFVPGGSWRRADDAIELSLASDIAVGIWHQSEQIEVQGERWGAIAARKTNGGRIEISFIEIDGRRLLPGRRYFELPTVDDSTGPTPDLTDAASSDQPWQSSAIPVEHVEVQVPEYNEPTFTFWGEVSDETKTRLSDRARSVQAHFYRQYGIILSGIEVHYAADYDAGEDAIEEVTGRRSRYEGCGQILGLRVMYINAICSFIHDSIDWGTFDHEYFHNLQFANVVERSSEAHWSSHRAAVWFLEGGAEYAVSEYEWSHDLASYDQERNFWIGIAAQADTPLRDMSEYPSDGPVPASLYGMGYLGVELLIGQAGINVLLDNRLMPSAGNWDAAFEEAVGMTTDEFYTLFAEWLPEQRAQTQSSSSSQGARGFVFLGDVSTDRQQEIQERYEAIQSSFSDRYDIAQAPATINIAGTLDDLVPLLEAEGRDIPSQAPCFWGIGAGLILVDGCEDPLPLERIYLYSHLLGRAPHPSAVVEDGHYRAGPTWLYHGTERYGVSDYRDAAGEELIGDVRSRMRRTASRQTDLSEIETRSAYYSVRGGNAVAWLAVDWLVQQAGSESYVQYLLQRPNYEGWEETFEAAFNLTVEAFYEQFAAYQRRGFR